MLRQYTVVFAWKCYLFCLCVHWQCRVYCISGLSTWYHFQFKIRYPFKGREGCLHFLGHLYFWCHHNFWGLLHIRTPEEKFTLEAFPKLGSLGSIFKIRPEKHFFKVCLVGKTCVSRCRKRCKRLEINPIILDRENVKKLAKIGHILILQFFGSFWEFYQPRVIGFISSL